MALRVGIAAAIFATLVSRPASADVRTEARAHFRRGMALVAEGQLEAGVAELEAAYETLPHPNVLYNIARAYAEAGRYEEALEYFQQYLASDPPDVEEVRGIVSAIETRIAASAPHDATAEATTAEPSEGTTTQGIEASEEEILALDEAANQIETLAEVAQSDTLRQRAARLRALADELRTGGRATTETGTSEPTEVATEPRSEPADGTEEAISIAAGTDEDLYEETVVSASRFAQNPLDAPNSTTIITRQDIRLSGLVEIGELLRRVAGVEVMRATSEDVQVGIRGFNQFQSPRVIMLINGRSTYVDALGSTFWGTQPINVEDIERIEVIRGPASALYGANGFSGVINIVTRQPGSDPGTEVALGVGNQGQVHGVVSSSGRAGRLGWRVSGGYNQNHRFSYYVDPNRQDYRTPGSNPAIGLQTGNANIALDYRVGRSARAYAEGGINYGRFNFIGAASNVDLYATGPQTYAMAGIQSSWGGIRAFWNHFNALADLTSPTPFPQDIHTETIDIEGEFARQFHFLVDHNLHLGFAYRRKHVTWNLFPEPRSENHYGVFFQDTLQLADPVILVLGFRVDRHPLLEKLQFSPRAALVFRPSEGTALRISSGRAFRTQTFLESYLGNNLQTPVPAISATGLGSYYRNLLLGDDPLKPEQIISTEIGFSASQDTFTFDVNAYVNRVQNLIIQVQQTVPYTVSDTVLQDFAQFSPSGNVFPFGVAGFENDPAVFTVVGGELMARVFPVRGLDLYANYGINKTFLRGNPLRSSEQRTSLHTVNAGVQYRSLFGLDIAGDVHFASKQVWAEQVASATGLNMTNFDLPAYYLVNARIGYRLLNDDLELGIVGYNITHNLHRQHPLAQVVGTRVMGTVAYRF